MGMTYSELSMIGRLRKISKCGPFSMFCKLIHVWKDVLSHMEVSEIHYSVEHFSDSPHLSGILPNKHSHRKMQQFETNM